MSTYKTIIDEEFVISCLKDNFSDNISNLEKITGGEGSQAYSFNVKKKKYVIRINKHYNLGFKKDEFAYKNYSKENIPIPKIYKIGKINNEYHFCISQKADGRVLNTIPSIDLEKLNEELFSILDKIHDIDISETIGYGKWDIKNQGDSKSWREKILSADEYTKKTVEKPSLFESSFLEKDYWDKIYSCMIKFLSYCPEERYLIHGDYSFDNILSDGNKITAVIDWEESMYGDFLFDVAWRSFWSKKIDYEKLYLEHYNKKELKIKNFKERVLCYKLYIGLRALSFYAYSNQEDKYNKLKETINRFL